MLAKAENDSCAGYPGMQELVVAVLYLAARSPSEQPDLPAA